MIRKIYNWMIWEVPEGLEPAKGMINGTLLGTAIWGIIAVVLCTYILFFHNY